jgi:hypothetical protein
MPTSIPQICLPIVTTTGTQIDLILAVSLAGSPYTVSATLPAGTYYNDRRFAEADNLANAICVVLEAQEGVDGTNGTWAATESAGDFVGKITLTRTAGDGSDDVTSLDLQGPITETHLGWASAVRVPDSETAGVTAAWAADYMAYQLWIPHRINEIILAVDEWYDDEIGTGTATPVHETQDYYGSIGTRLIQIDWLGGASVLTHYAADVNYTNTISATANDPNCAWEAFRKRWRILTGTAKQARWSPDYTTPSVYVSLLPRKPWIFDVRSSLTELQRSEDFYRLTLNCTQV